MQTKRRWMTSAIESAAKPQAPLPWTRQARAAKQAQSQPAQRRRAR